MPQTITMTIDAFLRLLMDSAWDRPSAFYEVASLLKIKNARELGMHARYDKVFWSSKEVWQEERDYLKRVFKGKVPKILNSNNWST